MTTFKFSAQPASEGSAKALLAVFAIVAVNSLWNAASAALDSRLLASAFHLFVVAVFAVVGNEQWTRHLTSQLVITDSEISDPINLARPLPWSEVQGVSFWFTFVIVKHAQGTYRFSLLGFAVRDAKALRGWLIERFPNLR